MLVSIASKLASNSSYPFENKKRSKIIRKGLQSPKVVGYKYNVKCLHKMKVYKLNIWNWITLGQIKPFSF